MDSLYAPLAQTLHAACVWVAYAGEMVHLQRSRYPVPPGMMGTTVKLVLHAVVATVVH